MGVGRVTQRILVDRVLGNLERQSRAILRLQDALATGQRVNRPSDDPLDARRAINGRAEIAKAEQYLTNISTAGPLLIETETSIRTTIDRLQRARELALQGANATNGPVQRNQIAAEIDQLLESVLVEANHQTNERYIFGGTRTLAPPFEAARGANGEITAVAYAGNDTQFDIEIGEGVRVDLNETGSDIFTAAGPGGADIFATLIQLRDNLRSGDVAAIDARLAELGDAQDQLAIGIARTGATQARLERSEADLDTLILQLREQVSDAVDADFAEVVLNLNAQQNAFQASLNAGARVIQPSLLDFVR